MPRLIRHHARLVTQHFFKRCVRLWTSLRTQRSPYFLATIAVMVVLFALVPTHHADAILVSGSIFIGLVALSWLFGGDLAAGIAAKLVLGPIEVLLNVIGDTIFVITQAAVRFFTYILYRFNQEVGFVDQLMVQTGWAVVRDVANWFFVIFLLVSAIATILNLDKYHAKRILPRLIVVALLINFSLFIAGFVINVTQGIMDIFVTQLAGDYEDIGLALLNGMRVGGVVAFDYSEIITTWSLTDQSASLMAKGVGIVFLLGIAFVFSMLALMLLYRIVILWVLMILSPLAFLAAILPATRKYWEKWVRDLIRWSIFGPIAVFFIWLSTYLVAYLETIPDALTGGIEGSPGAQAAILGTAESLLRYITIGVFLLLSYKTAKSLAGEAAAFAQKALRLGGMVALAPIGAGAGMALKGLMASKMAISASTAVGKAGETFAKSPIGKTRMARPFRRALLGVPERLEAGLRKEAETGFVNPERKHAEMNAEKNPITKHAHGLELAEKNPAFYEKDVTEKEKQELHAIEDKYDLGRTLRKRAPHLIEEESDRKKIMDRMTIPDWEKVGQDFHTSETDEAKSARKYMRETASAEAFVASARHGTAAGIVAMRDELEKFTDVIKKENPRLAEGLNRSHAAQSLGFVPDAFRIYQAEVVVEGGGIERARGLSAEDRREHGRQMSRGRGENA